MRQQSADARTIPGRIEMERQRIGASKATLARQLGASMGGTDPAFAMDWTTLDPTASQLNALDRGGFDVFFIVTGRTMTP